MSIFPVIDCGKANSKLSRKLLLGQLQGLPEFPNQSTNHWRFDTEAFLMATHTTQNLSSLLSI